MMTFKPPVALIVSSLVLMLIACQNLPDAQKLPDTQKLPDKPVPVPAKYTKFGYVSLENRGPNHIPSTYLEVRFGKSSTGLTQSPYLEDLAEDTCIVTNESLTGYPWDLTREIPGLVGLDAGAVLNMSKSGFKLAAFKAQTSKLGAYERVETNFDLSSDLSGATLEIPGATDGFPAMTVTLPNKPDNFKLAPQYSITKDSVFTWDSSVPGATVTLETSMLGPGPGDAPFSEYVRCNLKDDGSFSFPDTTKAKMDALKFTASRTASAVRKVNTVVTKGDALLLIQLHNKANWIF
jgi:hypothetical protein